jgi:transposase
MTLMSPRAFYGGGCAPVAAFPGNGQMLDDLAEIAALKKEVVPLRAERDILKKAAAFFAREAI